MKAFLVIACAVSMLLACGQESTDISYSSAGFTTQETAVQFLNMSLPVETTLNEVDAHTLEIILPEGYEFAYNGADRERPATRIHYTCTCSGGDDNGDVVVDGCGASYASGFVVCTHGNCSGECTGSVLKAREADKVIIFSNITITGLMKDGVQVQSTAGEAGEN